MDRRSKEAVIAMLEQVYTQGASDLLLSVGAPPQLRIGGYLKPLDGGVLQPADLLAMTDSLLEPHQKRVLERKGAIDFSMEFPDIAKFRFNIFQQRRHRALAARIIAAEIPSFEELGLPKVIENFADRSSGLFLVTGPAGSGKSTTLAAMIDHINRTRHLHVITIEDPIEYEHKHRRCLVDQREVGTDTDSFGDALHSILRQTPDVIMVGELRNLETIRIALTLAETGHLVLSTLHTQDTVHAITRIIDVFPADQQEQIAVQLSLALIGIVAQQLILTKDETRRILACEVMRVNYGISNLIRERKAAQIYSMVQAGRREGMITMNESLKELMDMDLIHSQAALGRTANPKELLRMIEAGETRKGKKR